MEGVPNISQDHSAKMSLEDLKREIDWQCIAWNKVAEMILEWKI